MKPTQIRRIQPVTRQVHWELRCACGAVLAECVCKSKEKHIEIWKDGCAFVKKWGGNVTKPSFIPVTAKESTAGQPRYHKLEGAHNDIIEAYLAGEKQTIIAQQYGVTPSAISQILKKYAVPTKKSHRWNKSF